MDSEQEMMGIWWDFGVTEYVIASLHQVGSHVALVHCRDRVTTAIEMFVGGTLFVLRCSC